MKSLVTLVIFLFVSLGFSQINNTHLELGDDAPSLHGIDQFGNQINSETILQNHKILLLFYRGNWCPYCRKHLKELNENLEALTKKGYYVIVVTPEKVDKIKQTTRMFDATFSIIHDKDNTIMNDYQVAFDVNQQNVTSFYKFTLTKINKYNEPNNAVLPVPATYVINQKGKITFVHYDPDYKKRADFQAVLKLE